jgi:hypothetical protein
MFRLLNVNGLLARDYQVAGVGPGWRVLRVDMMGGQESDSSAWTIALARGHHQRLFQWAEFLTAASPAGESQLVGDYLEGLLDRVAARLRDRTRRRDVARALRQGLPAHEALHLLVKGEGPLASWLQTSRAFDPAASAAASELLASLESDLAADRRLLHRGGARAPAGRAAITLAVQPSAELRPGAAATLLGDRLEQACAACRNLLTLAGSQPAPGRAEAVAQAVIAGSLEAWLDEQLRTLFPDQSCTARARLGGPVTPDAGTESTSRYAAALALSVPLWSIRQPSTLTVHVLLSIDGATRIQPRVLETLLGDAAALLQAWSKARRQPLVAGGDGWLGLLEHMTWDQDLFVRWLASAPLFERVARLAALGRPPESREKQNGWQALLSSIQGEADALRASDWKTLAPHLGHWSADQQGELTGALRRSALARMRAAEAPTAELAEWLAAWRQVGSPGAVHNLVAGLAARAEHTKALADTELLHQFWKETGTAADTVPALASLWAAQATCPPERVADLVQALPAADPRRQASEALAACAVAAAPDQPRLALPPLAQHESAPAAWKVDPAWRTQVAAAFAAWTAKLDRSQQHAAWRELLAHRATLARSGLLEE